MRPYYARRFRVPALVLDYLDTNAGGWCSGYNVLLYAQRRQPDIRPAAVHRFLYRAAAEGRVEHRVVTIDNLRSRAEFRRPVGALNREDT